MSCSNSDMVFDELKNCALCPHQCHARRTDKGTGYCRSGAGYAISSITLHKGEEPVISGKNGICNVFFSRCNMQCLYCQNYQISRNDYDIIDHKWTLQDVVESIITYLDQGIENVGFVSPSHMVPQMKAIINALHQRNYFPIVVYNTNGYDKVELLRSLEDIVDVYLPDFKYMDTILAQEWSGVADYPKVASEAIREMYRQKGNVLQLNNAGKVENGLIVRHLVLPGAVKNSHAVLQFLAWEISPHIAVSLMSQYTPTPLVRNIPPLNRKITSQEYESVVKEMKKLGFTSGWLQEMESTECLNPNFSSQTPFGE